MEIIAHQVDEIKSLRHGCDVVGFVDGVEPGRDCCSDHEVVLVELGSHFTKKESMVLTVFRKSGAVIPATLIKTRQVQNGFKDKASF